MRKLDELKKAAVEIERLGLQDEVTKLPIALKPDLTAEEYIAFIKEAIPALLPEDSFTPLTETIIAELSGKIEEPPPPTLEQEIERAEKIGELREIAKIEPQFKVIRGKLSSFKDTDTLREEMLYLLNDKKTPMKEQELPLEKTQSEIADKLHEELEKQPIKKPVIEDAEEVMDIPNEKELLGHGVFDTGDLITRAPFSTLFKVNKITLDAITANMKKNGFDPSFPIILWKNTVVDGHTRLEAAEAAGIKNVFTMQKEFKNEIKALEYAIHNQRDRRNLSDAELFKCIEALDAPMTKEEAGKKGARGKYEQKEKKIKPTHEKTAETLGISPTKVSEARKVMKDEKVKEEVLSGKKSISTAAKEVRKKEKAEKPVKVKEEKPTRIDAVCQVIKRTTSAVVAIEGIVAEADNLFVEWGEKSDIERTQRTTETVISVLKAMEIVEVLEDGKINIKLF